VLLKAGRQTRRPGLGELAPMTHDEFLRRNGLKHRGGAVALRA